MQIQGNKVRFLFLRKYTRKLRENLAEKMEDSLNVITSLTQIEIRVSFIGSTQAQGPIVASTQKGWLSKHIYIF